MVHISVLPYCSVTMPTRILALACAVPIIWGTTCAASLDDVELPPSIHVCRRNEDDYSACLTKAIRESWPVFVKGIPELGSPALEPLKVGRVERKLNAGPFAGSFILRDITFYGLANANISSAQARFVDDRIKLDLHVEIPSLAIECNYKAQGSFHGDFGSGRGHFNVTLDGLTAQWSLDGRVRDDRWIVEHFKINSDIKGMKIHFSDFFHHDQLLNDPAMLLIKPIILALSDGPLTDFVNNIIFSKVPVSKIFP